MSLITLARRRIRLARLHDARYRLAVIRRSYTEAVAGLEQRVEELQRAHVRDLASTRPASADIVQRVVSRAKAWLFA